MTQKITTKIKNTKTQQKTELFREPNYILAKESAETVGSKDSVALFCSSLAEIYRKEQPKLSDVELQEAIRNEQDPEGLAILLTQRFELLLENKEEKAAEQIFQDAIKLIEENNLSSLYIDIHMIFGDYNWDGNYKEKLNAMQAYIVALFKCFLQDMDNSSGIVSHIIDKLLWESGEAAEKLIDKMEKDITQWLINENNANKIVLHFSLWPFKAARKMYPYRLKPTQLQKVTDEIIKDINRK